MHCGDWIEFEQKLFKAFGIPDDCVIIRGQLMDEEGNVMGISQDQANMLGLWKELEGLYNRRMNR